MSFMGFPVRYPISISKHSVWWRGFVVDWWLGTVGGLVKLGFGGSDIKDKLGR